MAKTKYRPEYAQLARWMARSGLIDKEIARELGCSRSTLNAWKKGFPEFKDALIIGKEHVDNLVEDALLKRALGFEYVETKTTTERAFDQMANKYVQAVTKVERITKMVVPDTGACMAWLKNRRPDKWKDKHDVDVGGNITVVIPKSMRDE